MIGRQPGPRGGPFAKASCSTIGMLSGTRQYPMAAITLLLRLLTDRQKLPTSASTSHKDVSAIGWFQQPHFLSGTEKGIM